MVGCACQRGIGNIANKGLGILQITDWIYGSDSPMKPELDTRDQTARSGSLACHWVACS